MANSILTL